MTISPKRRAALRLQGRYMGTLRGLKPRQGGGREEDSGGEGLRGGDQSGRKDGGSPLMRSTAGRRGRRLPPERCGAACSFPEHVRLRVPEITGQAQASEDLTYLIWLRSTRVGLQASRVPCSGKLPKLIHPDQRPQGKACR